MKYLNLEKTFPDGRTFSYHKVHSIQLLSNNMVQVSLGSWYMLDQLMMSSIPDTITKITLVNSQNTTNEEFIATLLDQILLLPEWQNAELVDLSKPPPLPLPEEE